jgi:hypothetical protein
MSIVSLPCHLVSYNAVMANLYSFNRESENGSAPVLNNVRTFHVPEINSFSLQQAVIYLLIPSETSLRFSKQRFFFRVGGCHPHTQPPNQEDQCVPFRLGHHFTPVRLG